MKVFISYRRDDSRIMVERITDHLISRFGKDSIFKDVSSISPGEDFRQALQGSLSTCDVVLAIIGNRWLGPTERAGSPRIHQKDDFVRLEIETALRKRLPIIPVVVDGASIPASREMPASLRELSFRQTLQIRYDPDFQADFERLLKSLIEYVIDELVGEAEKIGNQQLAMFQKEMGALEQDELFDSFSKEIERNPHNVRAILLRGQWAFKRATLIGGEGYRQSIEDFRRVRGMDDTIADSRFGLGTLYYDLAMFDVVRRRRYVIHRKGKMRASKTAGVEMIPPVLEVNPDKHSHSLLWASLDEFQAGLRSQQMYDQGAMFFDPRDISTRIHSLRVLLGYEPALATDMWLTRVFTVLLSRFEPEGFPNLFEIVATPVGLREKVGAWIKRLTGGSR